MSRPSQHPASRPVLPLLTTASLILGSIFATDAGVGPDIRASQILMVLSFACALIFFGLHLLAWLLREHELWREQLRQGAE